MEKLLKSWEELALTRKNYDVRDWAVPLGGVREVRSLAFENPSDIPEPQSHGWLGIAEMYFTWAPGRQQPRRLEAGTGLKLLKAASGERHSLLLFSNHRVYSCGDNSRGQLGQKSPQSTKRPGDYQLLRGCSGQDVGASGLWTRGSGIPGGWTRAGWTRDV